MSDHACFSCIYYDRAPGEPTGACGAAVTGDSDHDPFWAPTKFSVLFNMAGIATKRSTELEPFDGQCCKAWRTKYPELKGGR